MAQKSASQIWAMKLHTRRYRFDQSFQRAAALHLKFRVHRLALEQRVGTTSKRLTDDSISQINIDQQKLSEKETDKLIK